MLEEPDLPYGKIIARVQEEYRLPVVQVAFLPLGADQHTAVYRLTAGDGTPYFLKLRRGAFDETSVALPKFLSDQGVRQIIPPLTTKTGRLWARLGAFKLILYPFVDGRNAYQVALSDRHWAEFGAALKRIHTTVLPPALLKRIQQETYTPKWRELTKTFLERVEREVFDDPLAVKLAALWKTRRDQVLDLVRRAEHHAQALQAQPRKFALCHSDIHAGNILIDANDAFYIVDWDDPILAPVERDLMSIGGGLFAAWRTPQEEETLFYQGTGKIQYPGAGQNQYPGYGQTQIDPIALAYYRYERIIQDIALFSEQIFMTNGGREDREQSLRYLQSNFLPGNTIEIAYKSDNILGGN